MLLTLIFAQISVNFVRPNFTVTPNIKMAKLNAQAVSELLQPKFRRRFLEKLRVSCS